VEEKVATGLDPNKAKTARRVIEVLEFFSEENRQATVMDIVRRYKRPQSSTSELLASLVEMGLLYKDPASKFYTLTPRAAILGSLSQPTLVRDGRLLNLADDLRSETGLGVALIGMVGLNAQIFLWKAGLKPQAKSVFGNLSGGVQDRLCDTAAGWLLLSTLPQQRCDGVLRRLNAEAPAERKFPHAAMLERVQTSARDGAAEGPSGFGASANMCAVLLQSEPNDRPMAIGFVYDQATTTQKPAELIEILREAVRGCVSRERAPELAAVSNAA
jgi:DNA-binding IclR family transcriptional regulator